MLSPRRMSTRRDWLNKASSSELVKRLQNPPALLWIEQELHLRAGRVFNAAAFRVGSGESFIWALYGQVMFLYDWAAVNNCQGLLRFVTNGPMLALPLSNTTPL